MLDDKGNEVTDQQHILKMIGDFYAKLYTSTSTPQNEIDDFLNNVNFDSILSEEQKAYLDQLPTVEEFDDVITLPKDGKTPGLDGLPIEFYRRFWCKIRSIYYDMI